MAISSPLVAKTDSMTLLEVLKRFRPDGKEYEIAEVLAESNDVLQDLVVKEGNLPTGDIQSIRNGLPEVYWRQMNQGVPASHSQTAQITETCATLEARAIIDERELALNGNSASWRFQENKAFIESMGQAHTYNLFYGDARKKSEGFTGFATRYSDLSAPNAKNIIDCGGTGSRLSSIYLIGWGDNVYCPYPKGSQAGLQVHDEGRQRVTDSNGNSYYAYETNFNWNVGLMVRDWRFVVRLANIDVDALRSGKGIGSGEIKTDTNILLKLFDAVAKIPNIGKPKLALYMNSDVFNGLEIVNGRTNSNLIKFSEGVTEFGTPQAWATFNGIPIRRVDQLKVGEDQVK